MNRQEKIKNLEQYIQKKWKTSGYSLEVVREYKYDTQLHFYNEDDSISFQFMNDLAQQIGKYFCVIMIKSRPVIRAWIYDDEI